MRKLATIREIKETRPIAGADQIEAAVVDGWSVVIRKGEFKTGDKIIFCEVDSFLPLKPQYDFLRKSSYKVMADGSEGFRLRTVQLRGQISQGLILPLADISPDIPMGTDVTDTLGIRKYEAPIPACISGDVLGKISGRIRETDQERIQNLPDYFIRYASESFEASEKLNGTSMTISQDGDEFRVCGHQWAYKESENQTFWKISRRLGVQNRIKGLNIALQGECIGEGIQSNPYRIIGQDWFIFDVWDIDKGRYMSPWERMELLSKLNSGVPEHQKIKHVPIVGDGYIFEECKDMDSILKYANGFSVLRKETPREGIVFKSFNVIDSKIVSFKVLSNPVLLKEKD